VCARAAGLQGLRSCMRELGWFCMAARRAGRGRMRAECVGRACARARAWRPAWRARAGAAELTRPAGTLRRAGGLVLLGLLLQQLLLLLRRRGELRGLQLLHALQLLRALRLLRLLRQLHELHLLRGLRRLPGNVGGELLLPRLHLLLQGLRVGAGLLLGLRCVRLLGRRKRGRRGRGPAKAAGGPGRGRSVGGGLLAGGRGHGGVGRLGPGEARPSLCAGERGRIQNAVVSCRAGEDLAAPRALAGARARASIRGCSPGAGQSSHCMRSS
jgi:hypothetical protein